MRLTKRHLGGCCLLVALITVWPDEARDERIMQAERCEKWAAWEADKEAGLTPSERRGWPPQSKEWGAHCG